MTEPVVTRRNALQLALAAGIAPTVLGGTSACAKAGSKETTAPAATGMEGAGLTAYLQGGQVMVRWNNAVVANYRTGPLQKYPYFSHLTGPRSGIPLTTESSLPFPHHRGVWLGCDPLNGGDYWTDSLLDRGQIRSIDLQLGEVTDRSVEIRNRCEWVRTGASPPLSDERRMVFRVPNDQLRLADFDFVLKAHETIKIQRAKHSFFAIRVAPDLTPLCGGQMENSAGQINEAGILGKPADWCCYYGPRAAGNEAVEGLAVMDHPENPWHPCPWFARDYGHLSPSPFSFLSAPWELRRGESLRLRYRVVLFSGTPQEAGLAQLHKEWAGV